MQINFTGYQAVPIKNIYLESKYCDPFVCELEDIAQKEGFGVKLTRDNDRWLQDKKTIIERNGLPYCISASSVSDNFFSEMNKYGIKGEKTFAEICDEKISDVYAGSLVRTIIRLDELIKELISCSDLLGNHNLKEKLENLSKKIKRGIPFTASLYLSEETK